MCGTGAIAGVLIGGQSSRMGTSKALLRFRGGTLVEHVVQAAQAAVDEIVLLGYASWDMPALSGLVRLADEPGFAGPLAGLVPLLEYASDRWAIVIACDMPLLESQTLRRLLDACDASADGVAFRLGGDDGFFPCCAAFHPRAITQARLELARSASLRMLIGRLRCRILDADAGEARRLRSFNTPEEYADLMRSDRELAEAGVRAR